jgi:hypothetical protein
MVSSPYAAEVIKLKFANFPAIEYVTGERILSKNYTLLTIRLVTLFFLILGVSGAVLWYESQAGDATFMLAIMAALTMIVGNLFARVDPELLRPVQ